MNLTSTTLGPWAALPHSLLVTGPREVPVYRADLDLLVSQLSSGAQEGLGHGRFLFFSVVRGLGHETNIQLKSLRRGIGSCETVTLCYQCIGVALSSALPRRLDHELTLLGRTKTVIDLCP